MPRVFHRRLTMIARCRWGAIVFFVLLVSNVFGTPASAYTPKDCVTAQLRDLGHSPQNDSWRALKEAAEQVSTAPEAAKLPKFSSQAALAWCRILGQQNLDLAQHWPSRKAPLIETDQTAQVDRAALIAGQERVRKFIAQEFDVTLAGRFALVAAQTDRNLIRMVNKGLRQQGKRGGRLNTDVSRFCNPRRIGGFAGRYFIGLCWPAAIPDEPRYDHLLRTGLLPILAHEIMHQAQYELAMDIPAQRLSDGSDFLLGPSWMVEGAAEYLELQFVTGPIAYTGTALFNLQSVARRTRTPLSEMHQSGSVSGGAAYGTARFAALLLAKKHGGRSLFDYFEALGRLKNREAAFESVFGQSMAAFEAEFETLRRDLGAAENYGAP